MPTVRYVPILKGKEGEYGALDELADDVRSTIAPMIEVPPVPYDWANERPAKSVDDHVATVAERLTAAWGTEYPIFLDLSRVTDDALANGEAAMASVLRSCLATQVQVVPVVGRRSGAGYLEAAASHHRDCGSGACIRLRVADFDDDVALHEELDRLLDRSGGLTPGEADLTVDLGPLQGDVQQALLIVRAILADIPDPGAWRRVILAASSFPPDLSEVDAGGTTELPRLEHELWDRISRRARSPRPDMIFADYGIAHPEPKDLDPRMVRMSASIRYTTPDKWLILKGRNVRQWGYEQYHTLSRDLIGHRAYLGPEYSRGDQYIADCAEGRTGPGNATTWRKVGTNHHLTLVARLMAGATPRDA